ncbi:uncharacterized protein LOC109828691, partial [Asparagus officinalis]|uniref:uncharacterized protein LOC109828691 n=1 Tax=Asparagus officinalis TaxID=4686 RepID=UPI00098E0EE1
MSEDFVQRSIATDAEQTAWALEGVNYFLESMGKTIQDFDLPKFKENEIDNPSCNLRIIQDEIDVEVCQEDIDGKYKLNEDQRKSFEIIMDRVNMNKGGVFFIDGPGGTGKTFLYKTIIANVRSKGMIAIATATSGVAASLLPGGRTSHSRFKIPINATETIVYNISKQEGTAHLIRKVALIIWDEAPMAKRVKIESVDRTMQDLLSTKELFGGKVVVFGGDFRQVLPVIPRGTRSQTVNASLVMSYLWEKMEKITLKINMRAKNDEEFSKFLLRVGNGTEKTTKDELIRLPESIVIEDSKNGKSEVELLNQVFPSIEQNAYSAEYMTERAILATKNEYVDELNDKLLDKFPGDEIIFHSFDKAIDDPHNYYQEEFLNKLMPNGLPPHKLKLKQNCPIMLLRNLDPSNGLYNGTRM